MGTLNNHRHNASLTCRFDAIHESRHRFMNFEKLGMVCINYIFVESSFSCTDSTNFCT